MFEGQFPDIDPASTGMGGGDDSALRSVSWADLSARLSAIRDLRRLLGRSPGPAVASFDPAAARRIARQASGKPGVNLEASAHGNANGANNAGIASDAMTGS
jgi:hypothetical protein